MEKAKLKNLKIQRRTAKMYNAKGYIGTECTVDVYNIKQKKWKKLCCHVVWISLETPEPFLYGIMDFVTASAYEKFIGEARIKTETGLNIDKLYHVKYNTDKKGYEVIDDGIEYEIS